MPLLGGEAGPVVSVRVPAGFRLAIPGASGREAGRLRSDWFGLLAPGGWPIIHHSEHGWLLVFPVPGEEAFWAFDGDVWFSATGYPWIYRRETAGWLYFGGGVGVDRFWFSADRSDRVGWFRLNGL